MSTLKRRQRKTYRSVDQMMAGLGLPRGARIRVADLQAGTRLVDWLVQARTKAGLTQAELARRMGCTQSRISKLEDSLDADLRLGDVAAYCESVRGR